MKGLIFNLLDDMARRSGCSNEAWDLVMEFVASETEHQAQSDTCLSCFDHADALVSFEGPAEAMIQCLGSDSLGIGESLSEFPDMVISEADEWMGDSIPALMDPDLYAPPKVARSEGFSNDLLSLLEQLLTEALAGGSDAEDVEGDEHPLIGSNSERRDS